MVGRSYSTNLRCLAAMFAAALLAGCAHAAPAASRPARKPPKPLAATEFRALASAPYARGNPTAPVTIIEFADYECPYCAADQPVIDKIMRDYGDRVRLVYHDYPLGHSHSELYARAARCAGEQDGFWKMHDYIFAHSETLDPAKLAAYGSNLGLDGDALANCVESKRYSKAIANDGAAGERAGVDGTPYFFVNGKPLEGMQGYGDLASAIDTALAGAQTPVTAEPKLRPGGS